MMFTTKHVQFLLLLTGSALILANPLPDSCELPNCRRPSPSIPGSLKPEETPQMVVVTFEDGVSTKHLKYINQLFGKEYQNSNGCPMQYTFFPADTENEYNVSTQLARKGHELASHSLTHRYPTSFWSNISAEDFKQEMVGMKTKLSQLSGAKVSGSRTPFLEVGGDAPYKVLKENGFVWDSSMLAGSPQMNNELPVWPFTLDEPVPEKYCVYGKCPKGSYPGLWEFPLNRLYNDQKEACSLVDECDMPHSTEGVYNFLYQNFNDHYYTKNRAPFGIFIHTSWLRWAPILESAKSFLKDVAKLDDVYVVTVSQAIDWVKTPTPLSKISDLPSWNCKQ